MSAFDEITGGLDYPMWVVTTASGSERDGCLVGFASQCSIDPARFVVWLSKANRTFRIAGHSDTLVVHLLREDDTKLAECFGGETGDEVDKLASVTWDDGPAGAPVLDGCDWFAGRVVDRVEGGDHVGFVLEPVGGEAAHPGAPALGYQAVRHIDSGHDA